MEEAEVLFTVNPLLMVVDSLSAIISGWVGFRKIIGDDVKFCGKARDQEDELLEIRWLFSIIRHVGDEISGSLLMGGRAYGHGTYNEKETLGFGFSLLCSLVVGKVGECLSRNGDAEGDDAEASRVVC